MHTLKRLLPSLLLLPLLIVVHGCKSGVMLSGEEKYIAGTKFRETTEFIVRDGTMKIEMLGQTFDGAMETESTEVVEVEVLTSDSLRLVQVVDVERETFSMMGEAEPEETHGALEGVPILGRRENGRWTFTLEEGTPTESQAQELDELAGDDGGEFVYPEKPVQVGDSWEIDPAAFEELLGDDIENGSGTGSMELLEVVKRHGHPCARLSFQITMQGNMIDSDGETLTMEMHLEGEIYRALDLFTEIEVQGKGHIKANGELTAEGQNLKMTLEGPLEVSVVRVDL